MVQESQRIDRKILEVSDQIGRLTEGLFEIKLDIREQREVAKQQAEIAKQQAESITRMSALLSGKKREWMTCFNGKCSNR